MSAARLTRPVLRYHGGKWMLAPWIIEHFPKHRVYTETFGGAASVLMRKPRSFAEIYNDRWGIVADVFRVLRDPIQAEELERRIRLTPYARSEFEAARGARIEGLPDPIERARLAIFRSFAGFGDAGTGSEKAGFRTKMIDSGSSPGPVWSRYPDELKAFTARLQGVVVENRPAVEVILQHDDARTLHYVDPPYPGSTRQNFGAYALEMTDDDHRELAAVLRSARGMVAVSGYACDLYDRELYPDWIRVDRNTFTEGGRPRKECMWLSPSAARFRGKTPLFQGFAVD